ncbi:WhiB family transcriptional regulator [Streptomyces sp. NPDC005356]|uniref:WhiB family transcriptional regulator n=1 Tax=unclassified Streptomyces TaxID=2593676 RepID=UPI0033B57292
MGWLDEAACAGEDPEVFFPVGTSGPALHDVRDAKRICHRCPVESECLEWALTTGQTTGVWGGMSETERTALFRANRRRAGDEGAVTGLAAPVGTSGHSAP